MLLAVELTSCAEALSDVGPTNNFEVLQLVASAETESRRVLNFATRLKIC